MEKRRMRLSRIVPVASGLGLILCACGIHKNAVSGTVTEEAPDIAEVTGDHFDREQLIQIAMENQKNSYAPYSKYHVSAAVLMSSGKIYTGVNVENASYPAGICAERNAIFHAIGCGETQIVAIAIVGGPAYSIHDYCSPCGICRQVMREFCNPKNMHVVFAKSTTDYIEMTLEELLPKSFGPEALQQNALRHPG